jgi:hypothetical protein
MRIRILLIAAGFLSTGCATLATGSGPLQNVRFNSSPPYADGNRVGKTPTSANLARSADHVVQIELSGYPTHVVLLKHGPNLSMLGNFIFPGPLGFLVDAFSGAAKGTLNLSVVNVIMETAKPDGSAESLPATTPSP